MKKNIKMRVIITALVVVLLAGCGNAPAQTPTPTAEPTQTIAPTPEPTPEPTPAPTPEPTQNYSWYGSMKCSAGEVDKFTDSFFETAVNAAPDDIAEIIKEREDQNEYRNSDDMRDFDIMLAGNDMHLLVSIGKNGANIGVIDGIIPKDEAAPYFLAAILSYHMGTDIEQAVEDARECIENAGSKEVSLLDKTDKRYGVYVQEAGDYYFFFAEYAEAVAEDWMSKRMDSTTLSLQMKAIMGK